MGCVQNSESFEETKPLPSSLEPIAVLFARPTDDEYERIVDAARWNATVSALEDAGCATERIAEPPATADYRAFANRVLTAGFPTSALPVESLYKHWDEKSRTAFARCDGCFDGASAGHIRYLCETWGLAIPDAFRAMPDHLSLLLELFGILAEQGATKLARQFAADHLDWLGRYDERLASIEPLLDDASQRTLAFYRALIDAVADTTSATLAHA